MAQNIKARLDEVKKKLAGGNTEKSAELLGELANDHFPNYSNTAILLQSRASSLAKNISMGIISHADSTIDRNRLTQSLNTLYQDLVKEFNRNHPDGTIDDSSHSSNHTNQPDTSPDNSSTKNSQNTASHVKTILFLTANPRGSARSLEKEHRGIVEGLKQLSNRDDYRLEEKFAVRVMDMRRALLDVKPDIVHFSVQGNEKGELIIENDNGDELMLHPESVGDFFEMFEDIVECVVLNADFSSKTAEEISQYIPTVIGMSGKIDEANVALNFATGFYDSLQDNDYEIAFKAARSSLGLYNREYKKLPVLFSQA